MELTRVQALSGDVLDEVERAVVGKRESLELVLIGFLADGHVLLEDFPGLAKTLAARSFAQVLSMRFARIQFTPDLMPSDVTGSSIWNQRDGDFEFRPGPIFTNLLLSDEINRAPPKTQAALLEAMQERQVTIEGHTHRARAAVPRHRDPEPDRVRGHVPAARGAARSLPPADGVRLPEPRRTRSTSSHGGSSASPTTSSCAPSSIARPSSPCRLPSRASTSHRASRSTASTSSPRRARRSRTAVGASPRGSLALLKLARCRAALRRPRLRAARRRQGGRRPGTRPPARAPARALGAARLGGGRRPRGARDGADAPGRGRRRRSPRVTRTGSPRIVGYASLAAVGLIGALALRRPELAVAAAPFALILAIGLRSARAPALSIDLEPRQRNARSRRPRSTPCSR